MKYKGKKVYVAYQSEQNNWALISYSKPENGKFKKKFRVKLSELTK